MKFSSAVPIIVGFMGMCQGAVAQWWDQEVVHTAWSPGVVGRTTWGAKHVLPRAKHHIPVRITIHHGGVLSNPKRSLEDKLKGLQTFSQREDKLADGRTKPAWPDIPYHYYIAIDGRIGQGRPWWFAGDTNTEYNPAGHLLIMVEGDFVKEKPTKAQLRSLQALTDWASDWFHISSSTVTGHGDHAKTDCPGTNLWPYVRMLAKGVPIDR